jgi:hypothetical protein
MKRLKAIELALEVSAPLIIPEMYKLIKSNNEKPGYPGSFTVLSALTSVFTTGQFKNFSTEASIL